MKLLHGFVFREKRRNEQSYRMNQTREISSNSDWFCQSNTFESLVEVSEPADDLTILLLRHGHSKYIDTFQRHEIDLETFINLTDEELKEIGITTFGKIIFESMAFGKHSILSSFVIKPMPQAIFLFKILELKSLGASLLILKGFFQF